MTKYQFVSNLDDLIRPEDYGSDPDGRRIRVRIRTTANGTEILADAMRPAELEKLLEELGPEEIQQMLCG